MKTVVIWIMSFLVLNGTGETNASNIYGNGTIKIGGIFDLESKSSKKPNPQIGIHFAEAVMFAIDQVNKDSSILHGFKFASDINKDNLIHVSKDISSIVNTLIYKFFAGYEKQAAIGPYKTYDSYKLSIVSNALRYPVISYSAPFLLTESSNDFFFRTVPEDSFRVMAMVDLLVKLGWDFVAVISSNDRDGDSIAREFIKKIADKRICYSQYASLQEDANEMDYDRAISEVTGNKQAKGLVLFTTIDDSLGLLRSLRSQNLTRRFQIIAAYGFTNYVEITSGNEGILEGSISIEYATEELPAFRDHFLALNMTSRRYSKFSEFWASTFGCYISGARDPISNSCTGNERLKPGLGYYPNTPVHLAINAVYALAYSFKRIIETRCSSTKCDWNPGAIYSYSTDFGNYLREHSFADATLNFTDPITNFDPYLVKYEYLNFVRNSTRFINRKVGSWSFRRRGLDKTGAYYLESSYNGTIDVRLADIRRHGNRSQATSSCRLPCAVGWISKKSSDYRFEKCCQSCVKCTENEVTTSNTCVDCGLDSKPDAAKQRCIKLPTKYFGSDATEPYSLQVYLGFSTFGILCTLFVAIMFIKNNDNHIVRASGRELCYFMLAGITLLFTVPFTFYFEPSKTVCSVQVVLPGIALCMCYSPLFLRTNRIYRIFCNARTSISRPPLITPQSQLALLFFIICVQVLLGIIWIVSNSPSAHRFYRPGEYAIIHCGDEGHKMLLNLTFSVMFMICCTWYAFKTRNFPKNYNESKYIGITMYITCICLAVFLPMYVISKEGEHYTRPHLLCAIMICIGFLTLLGLFGQKIKLLLFPSLVDESAQKQAQSQATRGAADPNKYQMQIHKIDALSMCKEPSLIHSNSIVVNPNA